MYSKLKDRVLIPTVKPGIVSQVRTLDAFAADEQIPSFLMLSAVCHRGRWHGNYSFIGSGATETYDAHLQYFTSSSSDCESQNANGTGVEKPDTFMVCRDHSDCTASNVQPTPKWLREASTLHRKVQARDGK